MFEHEAEFHFYHKLAPLPNNENMGDPVMTSAFVPASSSSSSLSGGAIAGIVVGCVVGVAVLILVAVKFSYRKGSDDMYQQLLAQPGQEMSKGANGTPI
eukprot:jgi/Pico_ML_1/50870/g2002.t1